MPLIRTALMSSLGGGAWENDGVSIVTETVKYLVSKFQVNLFLIAFYKPQTYVQ